MAFKTLEWILPEIIVCLNGTLPDTNTFHRLRPIPIAAADGAAVQLREKNVLPQYIVGDLDSLAHDRAYWEENKQIEIVEIGDQNSTDFEKTLDYVAKRNCRSILVVGMHGGEFDHTLNNWSILMRYGKTRNIVFYEKGKIAIPLYESVQVAAKEGEMISLIPQPSAVLTTSGLEWNLNKEELSLGLKEGARNRAIANQITIELHSGAILLFIKAELPYMPQIAY
ncbi:MAG: thiamine diphosphokinase [Candidatus Kapabacteria bacterium]|jgi:thiamine pyrophosphokinase|nr:thiamine diphosphokinase [Candidatus Kapabacteria bacterium]